MFRGTPTAAESEIDLYGSSRLGVYNVNVDVQCTPTDTGLVIFTRGNKFFELTNHLGNVLATISDKNIQKSTGGDTVKYYIADVVTANDYYPFGMIEPGRKYAQASSGYRYGFNGKEKSNEVYGEGNAYDFGARIQDPRLGRWLSLDPLQKKYPDVTPYHFCLSNPTLFIDPNGKDVIIKDQSGKTAAIYKHDGSIIITKGMENSYALHSYQEARTYLEKASNSLSSLEKSVKAITIKVTTEIIRDENGHSVGGKYQAPSTVNLKGGTNLNNATSAEFISNDAGTITWNPERGMVDNEGNSHSPSLVLDHEGNHAKHALSNLLKYLRGSTNNVENPEEDQTIKETNETSVKLNNGDGGFGKRVKHGIYNMYVLDPTYSTNGVTTTDKKVVPIDWKEIMRRTEKQARDNLGGTGDPALQNRKPIGVIKN